MALLQRSDVPGKIISCRLLFCALACALALWAMPGPRTVKALTAIAGAFANRTLSRAAANVALHPMFIHGANGSMLGSRLMVTKILDLNFHYYQRVTKFHRRYCQ
jgi:hypothetical protein